jgi:sulfoxide reductase heme-binding subunit YedZ
MARHGWLNRFARNWMKPLTLAALVVPGAWLAVQWIMALAGGPHALGYNPIETTHRFLGETALRVLLVTLAVTPLRDLTGWQPLLLIRRRIGLAAFAYTLLHVLAYVWLDLGWSFPRLMEDVVLRIYITLGMAAFLLMTPLAATSTNTLIRRLGRATWEKIHWLIYPLAILAVGHHYFMEKGDQPGPLVHAAILAVLLLWRIAAPLRRRAAG